MFLTFMQLKLHKENDCKFFNHDKSLKRIDNTCKKILIIILCDLSFNVCSFFIDINVSAYKLCF